MNFWAEIYRKTANKNKNAFYNYTERLLFVQNFAWAIPSESAIKDIADFIGKDSVLEIGAGNGLWAKLLADLGVNIVATDNFEWNGQKQMVQMQFGKFFPVVNIDAETAVKRFQKDVLMFVWPPMTSMAFDALKTFKGNKVIYIGEENGCTGTSELEDLLLQEWNEPTYIKIPQWDGLHDVCMLFTRKNENK